jgi:catechol 2,3-dioxygenase-like lactoylglutathione lyase family enzyme
MAQIGSLSYLRLALAVLVSALLLRAVSLKAQLGNAPKPVLVNTCLITANFSQLVGFYKNVLALQPNVSGGNYAEFPTGAGVLAIFSADAQEKYIPGSAQPAHNKSAILEFRVPNVDAEYARLRNSVTAWVKPPTTQPWGTRSFYFRDPDGNLVDFFSPAKTQ